KRYYKKFGRYPGSVDELENSNRMRFLRRRFKDPMSESGEWRLIRFGEVKTTPTGLFGKPIGATGAPGAAVGTPAAALGQPGQSSGTLGQPSGTLSQQSGTPGQSSGTPGQPIAGGSNSLAGRTFGGGAIVGVASTSTKESLKELNGKNHYNDWEFFYDPRFDAGPGGGQLGTPQQPGAAGATPQQQNQNPMSQPGMSSPNPSMPR